MQSIEQKDLYDYRFLSGVEFAPGGKAAAFVVSRADEEENGYQSHIWLWREGQATALTGLGAERSFAWLDENRLLFAASRTKAEKKRAEEGEVFTSYYAIDIRGGEAQKAFELPIQAGSPRPLDREKGLWLFAGTIDAGEPEEYKMSADQRKELAARRKEEADYEVLDEVPFWLNGGGFINKRRTALFLYNMNTGSLERLTAPLFDLSALAVLGGKAYWMGEEYAQKPALRQDLFCYDPADGSTRCLYSARQYDIEGLWAVGDKLAAMGTQHLHHGVNENCEFYRFDFEKADFVLWQHNEESLWNSVGSDCRYGGGIQQKAAGEWLYFTTTRRESSHLYRVGDEGIQPVITRTGSLDCFDICPETGEILLVGASKMNDAAACRAAIAAGIDALGENRVQEISSITRNLKIMAKEMDVPIIALSQLSRAVEKQGNNSSHRPQLSDLRDSGSIEQDADCVLFLYRDSYYASQQPDGADVDADTAECIVAKNRPGETSTVPLGWDGAHTRFMDVDFGH